MAPAATAKGQVVHQDVSSAPKHAYNTRSKARSKTRGRPKRNQATVSTPAEAQPTEQRGKRARLDELPVDQTGPGLLSPAQLIATAPVHSTRSKKRTQLEVVIPSHPPPTVDTSFAYDHIPTTPRFDTPLGSEVEAQTYDPTPEPQEDSETRRLEDLKCFMREQLMDVVYESPIFFKTWLSHESDPTLMNACRLSRAWNAANGTWDWLQEEDSDYYQHVADVLSSIAFASHDRRHIPFPPFLDHHDWPVPSEYGYLLQPDIVWCPRLHPQHSNVNWCDVQLVVTCKPAWADFTDALVETLCYVSAQFGSQYWRKFAFALFFIGTEATFLYVDRCGVVHSPSIDIVKDPEEFIQVFAALMRLDQERQGNDPSFRAVCQSDGSYTMEVEFEGRWYEVVETRCQQQHLIGVGTVVLLLSHKNNNDWEELPERFILKIAWREEERQPEGHLMLPIRGLFGVCQYLASQEFDSTINTSGFLHSEQASALISEDVLLQIESGYSPPGKRRWLNWLLLEAGEPLESITDEIEYADAFIDIIFAIWGLKNQGYCHRDISPGNIIIANPGCRRREISTGERDEENPDYVSREITRLLKKERRSRCERSELRRLGLLQRLGRNYPTAKLIDFHLMVDVRSEELITHRAGTRNYMARVLLPHDNEVRQHYQHDLESLFWVAYCDLASRRIPDEPTTPRAQEIEMLNGQPDWGIRAHKLEFTSLCHSIPGPREMFGTEWADRTWGLVARLCKYWTPHFLDKQPVDNDEFIVGLIGVYEAFKAERIALRTAWITAGDMDGSKNHADLVENSEPRSRPGSE